MKENQTEQVLGYSVREEKISGAGAFEITAKVNPWSEGDSRANLVKTFIESGHLKGGDHMGEPFSFAWRQGQAMVIFRTHDKLDQPRIKKMIEAAKYQLINVVFEALRIKSILRVLEEAGEIKLAGE